MKLAPLGLGSWFTLLEQLPLPLVSILLFADVPSHRGFITANCADPITRGPKMQSCHPPLVEQLAMYSYSMLFTPYRQSLSGSHGQRPWV